MHFTAFHGTLRAGAVSSSLHSNHNQFGTTLLSGAGKQSMMKGTIISKTAMENYKDLGPGIFKRAGRFSPAKRLGVPEEISPAVCFLLSPAASFISGETLKVDAGQSLYHSMWEIPDHSSWPEAPEGENTDTLREIMGPKSKL